MAITKENHMMSYRRRRGTSWEQAASRYLNDEHITMILPRNLGKVIGCSPIRAGVILRSLGWYPQRDRHQKNTVYYRVKPNKCTTAYYRINPNKKEGK